MQYQYACIILQDDIFLGPYKLRLEVLACTIYSNNWPSTSWMSELFCMTTTHNLYDCILDFVNYYVHILLHQLTLTYKQV